MVATALFGGSFDPVHLGHLHLIHTVYNSTRYKKFILVPVAINNFKKDKTPTQPKDRINMLKIAVKEYRELYPQDCDIELIVDDCEIRRGGVSYTYDTVKTLYENYEFEGKLGLVMGDDLIPTLKKWYRFTDLIKKVDLVVIRREESDVEIPEGIDFEYVTNEIMVDASSTIRDRANKNQDFSTLLSKEVYKYVKESKLYQT
ncbi:MAG: nicotinate (nicotinamide) nucleotide adenylyltransferase [Sphaerochaetaceae bacterium]|nr:nicotinate (nicotinamide) nucleotide adenylyltransferase [Sphaerochaetaceae bacterium]